MADQKHTILLTAAGGNIGTEAIPQLLTNPNWNLVLPTSNAERLKAKLPSSKQITVEEGSISDPVWIESILKKHGIDIVFLCLTGTDELMTTLNFFNAMERAETVKYLLYLSACGDMASPEGVERVMKLASAEHVVVKTSIEQKLKYADFPWETTVLGPTLFFSNCLRSQNSMLEKGIFNEPLGEKGVSWVSTADIALVIKNLIIAFPSAKYFGKKIQIGSLKTYTGSDVARLWSEAIGKEVRMRGSDFENLEAFEKHFREIIGDAAWARDLRLMFEIFAVEAFGMSEEEYATQVEVLGKEAEDYEEWVKKVGASWR